MDFRTGSNIADLSLHKYVGFDRLEGFDRFFGLAYVLLEWLWDRSKTMESNPALAASTAFAKEWV